MSVIEPGAASGGLIGRIKALILTPSAAWEQIDQEPATVQGLYTGYVIPLAAIGPVAQFLHNLLFGLGAFGVSIHLSPVWLGINLVVSYLFSLAMIYVLALIIEALAPTFGATKDRLQAFKVAAYAPTAGWVAGVFLLIPMLGILALVLGLYSFYLLYKGLPRLMKTEAEKALPYTAAVVVAGIVVGIVFGAVWGAISAPLQASMLGGPMAAESRISGKVTLPGAGSVDLGKLQEASQHAEAMAKQMQNGQAPPATDPDVLKAYLPVSVAGYARGDVEAASGGAGGVNGSSAQARYAKGDAHLELTVADMGAAGALAGMASAFNVHSTHETATGYEKVGKVNGRMTQESYDRASKHGEYSVLVGERFMVSAEGDGVTMDELKAAVDAVPAARLEGLSKG